MYQPTLDMHELQSVFLWFCLAASLVVGVYNVHFEQSIALPEKKLIDTTYDPAHVVHIFPTCQGAPELFQLVQRRDADDAEGKSARAFFLLVVALETVCARIVQ